MKVGYVLKMFPRLSETFVLNEILELEHQGLDVEIFSLNPPCDSRFHGLLARLKAPVNYLPRADSSQMWRALQSGRRHADIDPRRAGSAFLRSLDSKDQAASRFFFQAMHVASVVKERRIEHLHAHFATSATEVAMLAHMLSGVPFSFTAHAKDIYHVSTDPLLLSDALEQCAFAVTVTDYNVRCLAALTPLARRKVRRLYNGVRVDEMTPAPEADLPVPEIAAVGRLVEKKGFNHLVEACRKLSDAGFTFRCRIIGGGEEYNTLRCLIDCHGLEGDVVLEGAQPQEVVIEAMRRASVVVLPCIVGSDGNRDALPTVLLEAMALARSVVSTGLEGITEIVDHETTGLLVPQREPEALAAAIGRLLSDGSLRRRMGAAGREKAERQFNIRKSVSELADLFAISSTGWQAAHEVARCA